MIHLGLLINLNKKKTSLFFLSALTNDDELREVSGLLSSLIRKVDYGKDVEQELKFCVEARGLFGYIDSVTITLIQVNKSKKKKNLSIKICIFYRKLIN